MKLLTKALEALLVSRTKMTEPTACDEIGHWQRANCQGRFLLDCEDPEGQATGCGPLLLKYTNEKAVAKGNDRITLEGMEENKKYDGQTESQAPFPRSRETQGGDFVVKRRPVFYGRKQFCKPARPPSRAFRSDVWKVLRLHPGSGNKALITWQCLPRVQKGACRPEHAHMSAAF